MSLLTGKPNFLRQIWYTLPVPNGISPLGLPGAFPSTVSFTNCLLLSTRYGSDRRLAELSDYRRLSESQLSFRRSPTKSSLDYRRLPDAHSDYARYSGSYNDYLRAAQMHSGYQRRM